MSKQEIPHIIHYCWFGGKPLPKSALRCIDSWRRHLPGYEIKEWNEGNFDINAVPYTAQAAAAGLWAFVSDYARFDILYRHGGLYFDTDVEVVAPFDDIVEAGPFMGWEDCATSKGVAAGLGLGAVAGMSLYGEIVKLYSEMPFADAEGNRLPGTVVAHVTDILKNKGLVVDGSMQSVGGVTVYPGEYFCPLDDVTGELRITPRTHSIHHYDKTWCEGYGPVRKRVMRLVHRYMGVDFLKPLSKLLRRK